MTYLLELFGVGAVTPAALTARPCPGFSVNCSCGHDHGVIYIEADGDGHEGVAMRAFGVAGTRLLAVLDLSALP